MGGKDFKGVVLEEYNQKLNGRYACLTHCWGGLQPLKLLKPNIEVMKSGVEWDSLPKIFQDAVHVARELDLDFLWIDSLCIVAITITATSAPNCNAGFPRDLPPENLLIINLTVKDDNCDIFSRPSDNHSQFGFAKVSYDNAAPLRDRA